MQDLSWGTDRLSQGPPPGSRGRGFGGFGRLGDGGVGVQCDSSATRERGVCPVTLQWHSGTGLRKPPEDPFEEHNYTRLNPLVRPRSSTFLNAYPFGNGFLKTREFGN